MLVGISVFNSAFANNRTSAAFSFQTQIIMASFALHRGSFWQFGCFWAKAELKTEIPAKSLPRSL